MKLSISICVPVWNGSKWLKAALDSVYSQGLSEYDYEVIIGDDNPGDFEEEIKKTKEILNSYNDENIRYIKNPQNLGYPKNLKNITSLARKDIIFLMAQDDILAPGAIKKTHDAFFLSDNIGAVTRPYFWFIGDINKPVRVVYPPSKEKDTVLSVKDGEKEVKKIFESLGQLSGLAYKREYIKIPFHEDVFPAHIYPFAGILKEHDCVFLKDYTLAVRIESSQTIYVSSIYKKSPLRSWVEMFQNVFSEDGFSDVRKWGIDNISSHTIGLVQIKNYSTFKNLLREIIYFIKYRKLNMLSPSFYLFVIGCVLLPRKVLVKMVAWYKKNVYASQLGDVKFSFGDSTGSKLEAKWKE